MVTKHFQLEEHWDVFIKNQVKSGLYASETDVISDALREMEIKQMRLKALKSRLSISEQQFSDKQESDKSPEQLKREFNLKALN